MPPLATPMPREQTSAPHAARRRKTDPDDSHGHVHRRNTDADAVLHLHARVDEHDSLIADILAAQRDMTDNLRKLTDNTGRLADVLEAWNNVKGFWWTMKLLSTSAKIFIPLLAVAAAVVYFVKTGQWRMP